jgi:hypothetical protein
MKWENGSMPYLGEIQQRASTLNPAQLLNLVRGNPGNELQT